MTEHERANLRDQCQRILAGNNPWPEQTCRGLAETVSRLLEELERCEQQLREQQ